MTVEEAAQLVIQSSSLDTQKNIFVLDMGDPIKILDVARKIIELSGYNWRNDNEDDFIQIKITGLRPGEKLFEELSTGNKISKTVHPKIMSIDEECYNYNFIKDKISKFREVYTVENINLTIKLVQDIIKDYKPYNKKFDLFLTNRDNQNFYKIIIFNGGKAEKLR